MQNNGYPNPVPNGPAPSKGGAIASLVLSIIGLILFIILWCCSWIPFAGYFMILPMILSIVGIVTGISGRKSIPLGQSGRSMATAGMVISIITLILSAILLVTCGICYNCTLCGAAGAAKDLNDLNNLLN